VKINIAVDASCLSMPLTGIGRYLHEILAISTKHDEINWILCSDNPIDFSKLRINLSNCILLNSNMISPFGIFWRLFRLPFILRAYPIDIFWSPSPRLPFFLRKNIVSFVTLHDFVWRKFPFTMRVRTFILDFLLSNSSLHRANCIFAVSNATKEQLGSNHLHLLNKCYRIPLASFLPSYFLSSASPSHYFEFKYFLYVGTLEPRKNIPKLLKAFSLYIKNSSSNIKLVLVGRSGWGAVNVSKLISNLNLTDHVVLTGYISDPDLISIYKEALFLVMPSLYEGFGLPLLEAMSFGLPILTSNCYSMPEVAGNCAVYVDPHNIQDILYGIDILLNDPLLRDTLSMNALIRSKEFSWDFTASEVISHFKYFLNDK